MTPRLEQPDAMIFDLDGTLFQTETLIIPAFHAVFEQLRKEQLFEGETPSVQLMLDGLGLILDEIWNSIIPDSSAQVRERANELLTHFQLEGLKQGEGELYDGVASTLKTLHERGVRLFVASNGLQPYIEGVITYKQLAPLFTGLYSAGGYGTRSKVDLVRILLDEHDVKSAWMIGDRSTDVEAGKKNNLHVIGCNYAGFGEQQELEGSDRIITSFSQLTTL